MKKTTHAETSLQDTHEALSYSASSASASLEKIGALFKKARSEKKVSLKEAADDLHVRQVYLKAIEEGRIDDLPGKVYAVGFIKNYARYLNLDANEMLQSFCLTESYAKLQRYDDLPMPLNERTLPSRLVVYASLSLAAFVILGALTWKYLGLKSYLSEEQEELTAQSEGEPITTYPSAEQPSHNPNKMLEEGTLPSDLSFPTNANEEKKSKNEISTNSMLTNTQAASEKKEVVVSSREVGKPSVDKQSINVNSAENAVILAEQPSWVEVKDDSKILISRVLQKGETFTVPLKSSVTFDTGNAGGISLMLNGKKLKSLGGVGEVRRGITLDEKSLSDIGFSQD